MLIPHPHHQLLDVKQNPLPPQTGWGRFPCRKKKEKIPQPLKKSQIKKKKKKNKLVENYCQKLTPQKPGGGTSPPGKIRGEKRERHEIWGEKRERDMSQGLP
jgi:hypothetical protein